MSSAADSKTRQYVRDHVVRLGDQLTWDIRFSFARLHVRQSPFFTSLRDQLETEDTILCQKHVLGENVHAIDTFGTQAIGHRVISVEVLLQRATLNRTVTVCGESARQYRHISKATLKRFV